MGHTYADLKITNYIDKRSISVRALVDTWATFMCIPEHDAIQLGFDLTEVSQQVVTLADGRCQSHLHYRSAGLG
jgi:predicted aspartyl protease